MTTELLGIHNNSHLSTHSEKHTMYFINITYSLSSPTGYRINLHISFLFSWGVAVQNDEWPTLSTAFRSARSPKSTGRRLQHQVFSIGLDTYVGQSFSQQPRCQSLVQHTLDQEPRGVAVSPGHSWPSRITLDSLLKLGGEGYFVARRGVSRTAQEKARIAGSLDGSGQP